MKWLLVFICCLAVPGWQTYTDTVNKYSIDYPQDWAKAPVPNGMAGMAFLRPKEGPSDLFQENVNVLVQDLSEQPMTQEQFTELTKKQVTDNFGTSANLTVQPATLVGQNAKVAHYNITYQGRTLKIKQYWFVKGKKAYVFTYTASPAQFARYDSTATQVIKSFRFN
jgi:hypothetical protein